MLARFTRVLPFLLALAATAAAGQTPGSALPSPHTGGAIDRVLAPQAAPAFQTEVLVLGTPHLAVHREQLRPEHLDPLLGRLEVFAPTHIAVEALTGDEVALLAEREAHDPAAAELLDLFARGALTTGQTMQAAMGVGRVEAERRARATLAAGGPRTEAERVALVGHLLAAYESASATLQWSYLTEEARAEALPPEVRALLDRRLESANEIYALALPLARRLGLQELHPIDSQYDGVRILSVPRDALTALLSDPERGRLQDEERGRRADSVRAAAFAAGDLLPLYLHLNSPEHQTGDVAQWSWLFRSGRTDGLHRLRYALWELRNLRQAAHIADVAASGGRVLVLVGSSHKAYLDRLLATQLSVRLVQLGEVNARPSVEDMPGG